MSVRAQTMRRGPPARDGSYREVRGLTRGLALLRALNTLPGGMGSVSALSVACGLHRTTVKRLLETLRAERLVDHDDDNGLYALTFEVRRLAEGYESTDWVDRIAVPLMFERLPQLLWPSDIATPEGGFMVVRESTHRGSTLSQHRAMIGTRLPMTVTAVGRAYLAWCPDAEREALMTMLAEHDDTAGALARDRRAMASLLGATRRRGYAVNDGEWLAQANFAAVAMPVLAHGRPVAAVNLVFPKGAVSPQKLKRRQLPALAALVGEIGARLDTGPSGVTFAARSC